MNHPKHDAREAELTASMAVFWPWAKPTAASLEYYRVLLAGPMRSKVDTPVESPSKPGAQP